MGKNSLSSGLRGPTTLEFKDGGSIKFNAPDFKIGGTIFGERTIEIIDSIVWEDLKNKLRAVVVMGTYKPAGYFSGKKSGSKSSFMGSIYHLKDSALKPTVFGRNQKLPTDLSKLSTEIKTKISDIEGNWLTHLNVNKKQIWTIEGHKVTRPIN
jgi:hypothetical protein